MEPPTSDEQSTSFHPDFLRAQPQCVHPPPCSTFRTRSLLFPGLRSDRIFARRPRRDDAWSSGLDLSAWVIAALAVAGAMTFFALAMIFKIVTGREELIYYHHEIAVVCVAIVVLRLLHQPAALYLDITLLGIGTMLMCGRIGCLMVGCCHGQPSHWGLRYRLDHAGAGFPDHYVGVALFPVQLLEAVALAGILSVHAWLILHRAPGVAFAWYTGVYAMLRFGMEFLRGDEGRPMLAGFSEAQWTSLVLSIIVGFFFPWCQLVAALLIVLMIGLTVIGRDEFSNHLRQPRHVREIAGVLERLRGLRVEATSLGVRVSAGEVKESGRPVRHYALSCVEPPLNQVAAQALAGIVMHLRHSGHAAKLVPGHHDVFHLLVAMNDEG